MKMIGAYDLMIAATASVHNCPMLTKNTKEFERVLGLEKIPFARPL
jgi:predicted nucleic acid-binding protein